MAVDVEAFQDMTNVAHGLVALLRPADDVEVFFVGDKVRHNFVKEAALVGEFAKDQAEVIAIELDPEARALKMFDPACPQKTPPVFLDPEPDTGFAKVAAGFFAFQPLEEVRFLTPGGVEAVRFWTGMGSMQQQE